MNIKTLKDIPKNCGIYKIYNVITNDFYIGSAVNLRYRFSKHIKQLEQQKHFNPILQNSWNKYGKENFNFEIIEILQNKQEILLREQFYLDFLKPTFNIAKNSSAPMFGRKHTKEWSEQHSKKMSGRKRPHQSIAFKGENNPFYGKKHKPESIENMKKKLIYEKKSYGENNPSSKITWEIVNKIRYDREIELLSSNKLAKKYSLSKSQILRIVNYQSWKKNDGT